ncbi:type II toxin-antitoxin system HipA family toxin [Streptomyces sp. NPDC096310]|uniref:type II toxin-antitoxin system HipA family toxin n=1 Tax=Streptomyces sp. NPDC096310 TaxID=3366082 RepID=UPI00382D2F2D
MALTETFYAVLLHGWRIGTLCHKGDHTRFLFNESYLDDPRRSVLGLRFEEALAQPYASALRLPKWFSNLLPEGPLRTWIAEDRHVSTEREMELLAQVGHDLPGAVQVLPADGPDGNWEWSGSVASIPEGSETGGVLASSPWRFSLAGVALKFSMLAKGDRLTVPAAGEHGDWLVKFPDYRFPNVPHNEFTMMNLAREVGIDVPEVRLIHRDELPGIPSRMWPNVEEWAYAVRRFDRVQDGRRSSVHIEDFAQVRDKYPHEKYQGTFETVAAISYRGQDVPALQEFARRLAFFVVIGNGDAHLKNWSLIYPDARVPTLSPAYDLVSTALYREQGDGPEDLGLKFSGTRSFERIGISSFTSLESRLDRRFGPSDAHLADIAARTVRSVVEKWPEWQGDLAAAHPVLADSVTGWITGHSASLLGRVA